MLKKLRTSKRNYWIKQWYSSIASLFKMGTSRKGKNLLPGSEFYPLRAVSYGMENHFYHNRWPPLNVTIFITHMHYCIMAARPMHKSKQGRPWSDCFWRSSLILVCTVCQGHFGRQQVFKFLDHLPYHENWKLLAPQLGWKISLSIQSPHTSMGWATGIYTWDGL